MAHAGRSIHHVLRLARCTDNPLLPHGGPGRARAGRDGKSGRARPLVLGAARVSGRDDSRRRASRRAARGEREALPAAPLSSATSRGRASGPRRCPNWSTTSASSQDVSGRTSTLAIHPGDADTMLLGTAEGRNLEVDGRRGELAFGGRAVAADAGHQRDPLQPVRSEPGLRRHRRAAAGAGPLRGFGLARSRDGGETWELLPAQGNGWNFNFTADHRPALRRARRQNALPDHGHGRAAQPQLDPSRRACRRRASSSRPTTA